MSCSSSCTWLIHWLVYEKTWMNEVIINLFKHRWGNHWILSPRLLTEVKQLTFKASRCWCSGTSAWTPERQENREVSIIVWLSDRKLTACNNKNIKINLQLSKKLVWQFRVHLQSILIKSPSHKDAYPTVSLKQDTHCTVTLIPRFNSHLDPNLEGQTVLWPP